MQKHMLSIKQLAIMYIAPDTQDHHNLMASRKLLVGTKKYINKLYNTQTTDLITRSKLIMYEL